MKDQYKNIANWYDRIFEPLNSGLRNIGMKMYPAKTGMDVLDIGCGTGAHLKLYQKENCNIYGIDFVEMEEASSCCGFGGTFSVENYEMSLKINDLKISRVIHSNAEKVLTGCPGCIMQLQGGLLHHGSKIKVSHWVEEVL